MWPTLLSSMGVVMLAGLLLCIGRMSLSRLLLTAVAMAISGCVYILAVPWMAHVCLIVWAGAVGILIGKMTGLGSEVIPPGR